MSQWNFLPDTVKAQARSLGSRAAISLITSQFFKLLFQ